MPYTIRKRNSNYVVINKKTGKVKGKHKTKKKALAHMRALYAVEKRTKKRNSKKRS